MSLRDFRVTAGVYKEFGCYNINSGSSCLFHHDMYHVQTLYCGPFSLSFALKLDSLFRLPNKQIFILNFSTVDVHVL